ncbi:hypothetical protein PMKS-000099 [Pichia membranifaciens]|uniref:Uncharacterized protein n=1 Tax=Pichia membranifaciens TaxID=4926 RepID=A0A1Q2YAS4_9ASCO|nr:hypothetical protein PMKS-000099 [Pichia membranifaciens]
MRSSKPTTALISAGPESLVEHQVFQQHGAISFGQQRQADVFERRRPLGALGREGPVAQADGHGELNFRPGIEEVQAPLPLLKHQSRHPYILVELWDFLHQPV